MYQQDYILRQIEMLGALLKRMLQSISEGRTGEPLEMIDEVFEDIAGTSLDFVDAMPVEGLLTMLSAGGQLDGGRTALLGMLLCERALALDARGDSAEALEQRTRGLALLDAVPDEPDAALANSVAEFRHRLDRRIREQA